VKCFGVFRIDSKIGTVNIEVDTIKDVFKRINELIESDMNITFGEALIYVNGDQCTSKHKKLNDRDEIWLVSPASVG
jgi:molybdopterin converting factor small subunit